MSAESNSYLNMRMAVSARKTPHMNAMVSITPLLFNEPEAEVQIQETPFPHIKEVWFPGTHNDM